MRKVVVKWCLFRHNFPLTHSWWLHDYGECIRENPFPIFHFHRISGKTKSFQLKFTSCHQPTAYNHHRHSKFKTAVLIRKICYKKMEFPGYFVLKDVIYLFLTISMYVFANDKQLGGNLSIFSNNNYRLAQRMRWGELFTVLS